MVMDKRWIDGCSRNIVELLFQFPKCVFLDRHSFYSLLRYSLHESAISIRSLSQSALQFVIVLKILAIKDLWLNTDFLTGKSIHIYWQRSIEFEPLMPIWLHLGLEEINCKRKESRKKRLNLWLIINLLYVKLLSAHSTSLNHLYFQAVDFTLVVLTQVEFTKTPMGFRSPTSMDFP